MFSPWRKVRSLTARAQSRTLPIDQYRIPILKCPRPELLEVSTAHRPLLLATPEDVFRVFGRAAMKIRN